MSDDDAAWEHRRRVAEARARGVTFPDGRPVGEWVVICTNPKCLRCGRNPDHLKCPVCGADRIATVDFIRANQNDCI